MPLDTWQLPTNWPNQMTSDPTDNLTKIVCGSYQQIADVHSQSAMPPIERRKMTWRVIAVCKGVNGRWLPTEDCPYLDSHDPLDMARKAVENGDLITAQKKIGMHHYELWAQVPKTVEEA